MIVYGDSGDAPVVETKALPRYKCHKEVEALKIEEVVIGLIAKGGGATLVFENDKYNPLRVDERFFQKHKPKGGDYWVRYKDGYESVSPADAFEEGYTLLE